MSEWKNGDKCRCCTCKGHPSLDGCCSVACRDLYHERVDTDALRAENEKMSNVITKCRPIDPTAEWRKE